MVNKKRKIRMIDTDNILYENPHITLYNILIEDLLSMKSLLHTCINWCSFFGKTYKTELNASGNQKRWMTVEGGKLDKKLEKLFNNVNAVR